jgi:hypothetical protein
MRTTLAAQHTGTYTRLFPADTRTGEGRGGNHESARRLLLFVDRRFTFAQRVFGWNLDPETRLGRVLLLRRQAFEAERAGAFRTADFLWVEAHRALRNAVADPAVWRHALDISTFSPAITPEILRTRFIQELFIDLHRALFDSGRAAAGLRDPSDRAFVHCAYIERLVDLAAFDPATSAAILRPMIDEWLAACRNAGQWKRAIRICRRLAGRLAPDSTYLDELVVCMLRMTIDRLTRPPGSFTLGDARHLRSGIRTVELVCEMHGPTALILAALARLHAMHAVALGNAGDCAEALVEIAVALDYGGDDAQVRRTREMLTAAMRDILQKASARRLAGGYGAVGEDPWLDTQASRGFGPVTQYQLSARSARIREMRRTAGAAGFSRESGL